MWQADDPQQAARSVCLARSSQPDIAKEAYIVTKGKIFRALVLGMALIMLFSVTAFAGSVSWNAGGGITGTGYCYAYSATTNASSPTYVYVEVSVHCENVMGAMVTYSDNASNSGTSISASVSSDAVRYRLGTTSVHTVGSSTEHCDY